jgi:hypothetical protein
MDALAELAPLIEAEGVAARALIVDMDVLAQPVRSARTVGSWPFRSLMSRASKNRGIVIGWGSPPKSP